MARSAIVDTGPLVAYLDRSERHHGWVAERVRELDAPLLVCEPVLAEAMYLLSRATPAQDALLTLLQSGALRIAFAVQDHVAELRSLIAKYQDMPMSLADACVVCMAQEHDRHCVLTLDADFLVYRKHAREPLDIIHP